MNKLNTFGGGYIGETPMNNSLENDEFVEPLILQDEINSNSDIFSEIGLKIDRQLKVRFQGATLVEVLVDRSEFIYEVAESTSTKRFRAPYTLERGEVAINWTASKEIDVQILDNKNFSDDGVQPLIWPE